MLGGGVNYTFPAGVNLAPGASLLVVDFDPIADPTALANFRAFYDISSGVPVYGPYAGALNNAGDTVELYRPDTPQAPPSPDAGFVPRVLADRVEYTDAAPWPTGAVDGGGLSLQRLGTDLYGNEPLNWLAAAPTPGADNSSASPDTDGDGIPDSAEDQMGLNRNNPLDAGYDPDGDGMTNLQEYLAGTNHLDVNSRLRLDGIVVAGEVTLSFQAVAGRTYSILQTASLSNPTWTKFADVPTQSVTQKLDVTGSLTSSGTQFYRLVTPALP